MKSAKLPQNEDLRIELLNKLDILDTEAEAYLDRITKLASDLLGTPITLISLVDENRQWFKSKQGLGATETPREVAFCAHAILGNEVFVIEDATKDERFHDNPLVTDAPNVIFYAGYPLEIEDGLKIGTLCAIDNKPKKFSKEEENILYQLGQQVEDFIRTRYQLKQSTVFSTMLEELHKLDERESISFGELATSALEIGAKVFELDFGIISRVLEETYTVDHCISPNNELVRGAEFEVVGTYCAEVIKKEETVSYKEVGKDEYLCQHPVYVNMKLESYISTPIWVNDKIYGTLNYSSTNIRKQQFSNEEKKFIEILAQMLGKKIKLQQQAENIVRVEQILENSPEYVEMINLETNEITYANTAFKTVSGKAIGEQASLNDVHPEWAAKLIQNKAYPQAATDKYWRGETAVFGKDQKEIPVLHTLMLHQDTHEGATYASSVMRDISERKSYENELKTAKANAEKANIAKSTFLANMSHEIRTPLYGISGTAELLKETQLNEDQQKYLKALIDSSSHLTQIVNDILDLSKLESDLFQFSESHFNFEEEFELIAGMFKEKTASKGIELKFINNLKSQWFHADNLRIRQVLINIIGNAVKFTAEGAVTVELKNLNDRIQIAISDTGIGIPDEKIGMIFNAFSQVDDSYKKNFKGTGLGLAISKKIVEMMQGVLIVTSEANKGSTFTLTLPLKEGKQVQLVKNDNTKSGLDLSNHKVLVVDDNQVNLLVITKFLKEYSPKIDIAKNGKEALHFMKENDYDLILMDMQMPVLDGYSAVKEYRIWEQENRDSQQFIVALSAYAFESEVQKSLDAGCDDYISKPVKRDYLRSYLEDLFLKKAA